MSAGYLCEDLANCILCCGLCDNRHRGYYRQEEGRVNKEDWVEKRKEEQERCNNAVLMVCALIMIFVIINTIIWWPIRECQKFNDALQPPPYPSIDIVQKHFNEYWSESLYSQLNQGSKLIIDSGSTPLKIWDPEMSTIPYPHIQLDPHNVRTWVDSLTGIIKYFSKVCAWSKDTLSCKWTSEDLCSIWGGIKYPFGYQKDVSLCQFLPKRAWMSVELSLIKSGSIEESSSILPLKIENEDDSQVDLVLMFSYSNRDSVSHVLKSSTFGMIDVCKGSDYVVISQLAERDL